MTILASPKGRNSMPGLMFSIFLVLSVLILAFWVSKAALEADSGYENCMEVNGMGEFVPCEDQGDDQKNKGPLSPSERLEQLKKEHNRPLG